MTDKEFIDWIYETLVEINQYNYDDVDVCEQNNSVIDVLMAINERKETT